MHLKLADRKEKLATEVSDLERRLQELMSEADATRTKLNVARGGLAILCELEEEQASHRPKADTERLLQIPAVKLTEAVEKAIYALKRFTRDDLEQWIRSNYPQIQFSGKSVDGPMREFIANGEVIMLRRNTGNKSPAVYGLKETPVE